MWAAEMPGDRSVLRGWSKHDLLESVFIIDTIERNQESMSCPVNQCHRFGDRCFLAVAIILVACAGCGGESVDLGSVSGQVLQGGQPLGNAWVEFFPEFDGRPSAGRTDGSGNFELSYAGHKQGARIGKHTVKIGTGGYLDPSDPEGRRDVPRVLLFEQAGTEVKSGKNTFQFEVPAATTKK